MFELSVASKYLLPRRRQLSVSIISLVSVLVISLVVWLIVVFFSVTEGLEKSWINKLTALTAPIRITPTEAYYRSYYYQIDSISAQEGYSSKSIGEKLLAASTDPYNPTIDEEIPANWPEPDRQADGSLKDPVKIAFQSIHEIKGVPGLLPHDYELAFGNVRLRILRDSPEETQSFLSYPAYLGSFEPSNSSLQQAMLSMNQNDIDNVFKLLSLSGENILEDAPNEDHYFEQSIFHLRLNQFLSHAAISQLTTPSEGWLIPASLLPLQASWSVYAVVKGNRPVRIIVPLKENTVNPLPKAFDGDGYRMVKAALSIHDKNITLTLPNASPRPLAPSIPIALQGKAELPAQLVERSIAQAGNTDELQFHVKFSVQDTLLEGIVPFRSLKISAASSATKFPDPPAEPPLWTYAITSQNSPSQFFLPRDAEIGDGILVPKSFKDTGVLIGDRGYLSYQATTATAVQEQRAPVYVSGFYDPGIIPLGGKFILANQDIVSLIRTAQHQSDQAMTNGINVRLNNLNQATKVKEMLLEAFKKHGIDTYWNIETYKEYEFTKDIIQQLQSEKNLFTLLATVIIIVACSNIISMLIILVNDKKTEIGVLRSMGATSKSIAAIFGVCGCLMGLMGSLIGIGAAIITLKNFQALIDLISRIQGYELFNRALYGETMPHELSFETLTFVLIATVLISLLAGVVPAVKASLLRPSAILRSE